MENLVDWELKFESRYRAEADQSDPSHDFSHFKRVVNSAKWLASQENGQLEVILPAAWFHDWVNLPKDHPNRAQASRLSAQAALGVLQEMKYPSKFFDNIAHAIESHSFSAKIEPKTLEAKILQDADRLDALGAIGIARCFITGGKLNRPLYHQEDPFGKKREWDDRLYTIDHFYKKLLLLPASFQTNAGREEAMKRVELMNIFLDRMASEIL